MDYSRYVFSLTEKIQCLIVSLSATMLLAWLFYRSLWGMGLFPVVLAVISRQMRGAKLKKRRKQSAAGVQGSYAGRFRQRPCPVLDGKCMA